MTVLAFLMAFAPQQQEWRFVDVSQQAGVALEHKYSGERDPEFIAAGAAAGDYDNDGWVDLYVLAGETGANALYRNRGDGTFENVAAQAGVAMSGRFDAGPAFADVDGDGWLDLFVGGVEGAKPKLFRNRGDGAFEDITARSGLTTDLNTLGAAFADIDKDGDLDLFMTHWRFTEQDWLWLNQGDGTFVNADERIDDPGPLKYSFTPNFADIDNDGWLDLLVASDLGNSQYYLNDGTGRFKHATTEVITDDNGMGAAVGDYDNDGDLDWFVTSVGDPRGTTKPTSPTGNRLYRNEGGGVFVDATDAAGVREGYWGWGASFADFNNDGHLDIFHVNGFLGAFGASYLDDPAVFFLNKGDGSFEEVAADLGLADTGQGRGVICFDYDRDGDADIFIANNDGAAKLYRNDGPANAYLQVRLAGGDGNSEGVGARISIEADGKRQFRELRAGNNFVSQNPAMAHFGLGAAERIDSVTVVWPNGQQSRLLDVAANQLLTVEQPSCAKADDARWLPHVTRDGGGFQSDFYLANFGDDAAELTLRPFAANGAPLTPVTTTLAAGERRRLEKAALFGGEDVSHAAVDGPDTTAVSVGYRFDLPESAVAQVHEQRGSRRAFSVYPGNWTLNFDGLALINLGNAPARISASQVAPDGSVLAESVLAESLAPGAKLLSVFESVFQAADGAMIRVVSDQPAQATLLRGTRDFVEPALLFEVAPLPAE